MTETGIVVTQDPVIHPLQPFALDNHRVMVGDLVLDLALRTIQSRYAQTINLSGNEFAVLATLIKTPGEFVSKADLLEAVAGRESEAHHSVVDTYAKYLRWRLQEAHSAATIEKKSGVGFRLLP